MGWDAVKLDWVREPEPNGGFGKSGLAFDYSFNLFHTYTPIGKLLAQLKK